MYSIRLDGDANGLMSRMKELADVDKTGINKAIGEAIRSSTVERFSTNEDPEGNKWRPSVRAEQDGGVTLVKSTGLKNSIKSTADSSGFVVGTNKVYASTHQLGAENRRITIRAKTSRGLIFKNQEGKWRRKKQVTVTINIPARPFLGLSEADKAEIKGTIDDYFAEE